MSRKRVFGQGERAPRAGLYARVSTHDQQTLPMQLAAMRDYARKRGWQIAFEVKDVGSGRPSGKNEKNCWLPRAGARLTSLSSGGSTAGDARWWIW